LELDWDENFLPGLEGGDSRMDVLRVLYELQLENIRLPIIAFLVAEPNLDPDVCEFGLEEVQIDLIEPLNGFCCLRHYSILERHLRMRISKIIINRYSQCFYLTI
jgi:hypothetical protein